jgi:NAD(P)-dependent dehydrogenase (short-subunit alcohol dehydrogenase family)
MGGLLDGRVCVVTGANSGIGLASALGLAQAGAQVVLVCRSQERGAAALASIAAQAPGARASLALADLRSLAEVRRLAEELARLPGVDVLVNNAGTRFGAYEPTPDGYESTFALNHLAPFLLTNLLAPALRASAPARVIAIGSSTHRRASIAFDDLMPREGYDESRAYDQSKLADVLFTNELARRWAGTGVTALCVDPGAVDTGIGRSGGPAFQARWAQRTGSLRAPEQAARTVVWAASAPELEGRGGLYLEEMAITQAAPQALDEAVAQRLWEVSERLTGLG